MKPLLTLALSVTAFAQTWVPQTSGVTASLRGVSAVSPKIVWASGSGGHWLRTLDGGEHWQSAVVPGAEKLDFRAVVARNENTAWLMSIGPGDSSRIYQTTDAGSTWKLLFTNPDAKGFFDGLAFRDSKNGILLGDAVDGRMTIFTTGDGGHTWTRSQPVPALPEEGAFAASNSSLATGRGRQIFFGTGGRGAARVHRSADGGKTWTVTSTPVRSDNSSAGIFSLAFSDARHGIAVGGDYAKDKETTGNIAVTADGGKTWTAPANSPGGFRSAVTFVRALKIWLATGTSGSDLSIDHGKTWKRFDNGSYNALAVSGRAIFAVGAKGAIARFQP